jgi:hypothetical protein
MKHLVGRLTMKAKTYKNKLRPISFCWGIIRNLSRQIKFMLQMKTGSGVKKEIFGLQLHQKDVLLKKQQLKYEKKRKNMLKEIILKAESEMPNNHSPSTK